MPLPLSATCMLVIAKHRHRLLDTSQGLTMSYAPLCSSELRSPLGLHMTFIVQQRKNISTLLLSASDSSWNTLVHVIPLLERELIPLLLLNPTLLLLSLVIWTASHWFPGKSMCVLMLLSFRGGSLKSLPNTKCSLKSRARSLCPKPRFP